MGENAEIFEKLSRIEQTMARIDERTSRQDGMHADHEARLRAMESRLQRQGGWMAGAAFVVALVVQGVAWLIKHLAGGG